MMNLLFFFTLLTTSVIVIPVFSVDDPVFNDDILGLIVFKAGLQDPNHKLSSWNDDDFTPCNWEGVKCDASNNRVTSLVLDGFSLSGHIDRGLLRLQFLQTLSLSGNNFTGFINPDLPKLGGLEAVDFSDNNLQGSIPEEFFQQCGSLKNVNFAKNNLSGNVPDSLSTCASLTNVNFSCNQIHGKLPSEVWFLRGLKSFDVSNNLLEGEIVPEGIQNLYDLRELSLRKNRFTGRIPEEIGGCVLLRSLDLSGNFLSGGIPQSMQRLSSCNSLSLQGNSFTGNVPDWIGEMKSLENLDLSSNRFSGLIPKSLGKLEMLQRLNFSRNQLTGNLPDSMIKCTSLSAFDISHNNLDGYLPSWIFTKGNYHGLEVLDLSSNGFSGGIPSGISGLRSLKVLNMSSNNFYGSVPVGIGELKSLYIVDLSGNKLNGSIPFEIEGAVLLNELRLQKNLLHGRIPDQIAKCSALTSLVLSHNKLSGSIPKGIANLTNLRHVDLSWNKLSGSLPKELTNLSNLLSFNVSYNHLQGELPVGGFFNTISSSSVTGNSLLCGSVVNHSCPSVHPKPIVLNPNSSASNSSISSKYHRHKIILSISALIAIGAAAFIAVGVVAITFLNMRARSSMARSAAPFAFSGGDDYSNSPGNDPNYGKLVMFSGDADFADGAHNLLNKESEIGRGGFGVVYRTFLRDGHAVAIKKLTVTSLIKSQEEFEKEVKRFGKIRHDNLLALEGYYWTSSLQLLIYKYQSSGSLHKLLHGNKGDKSRNVLSWRQRFKIILGMAKGLAHLHESNVIHYNLKSANVLFDVSDEPKIGDFGLVKLLPMLDHCVLSSKIQSALGYMAPEFACRTVKITEKCDVYGFGILILEIVTGKKPVEYMEDDVVVLCDMVRGALEEGKVEECVDEKLLGNFAAEEAIPVIKLGLICASQVPSNRPDMSEVINILELIQCPSEGQEELLE
ncbi:hypothetical protein RYX36_029939 [Vicia faba]